MALNASNKKNVKTGSLFQNNLSTIYINMALIIVDDKLNINNIVNLTTNLLKYSVFFVCLIE